MNRLKSPTNKIEDKNKICKYVKNVFNSSGDILKHISHHKDNTLKNIKLNGQIFIKQEPNNKKDEGTYGIITDHIFKNYKTNKEIIISEKQAIMNESSDEEELDEIKIFKIYPNIASICPNIIPIRLLNNKVYMLKGDGDLHDLINHPLIHIDINIAHQIIDCLKRTLLCLLQKNIYYFDLKLSNIIFKCIDNDIYIWLIDLGSMHPHSDNELGHYYVTMYPHPIVNSKNQTNQSEFITAEEYNLKENVKSIYAYQLSCLFFNLLNMGWNLTYIKINSVKKNTVARYLKTIVDTLSYLNDPTIREYERVFLQVIGDIKDNKTLLNYTHHEEFWWSTTRLFIKH